MSITVKVIPGKDEVEIYALLASNLSDEQLIRHCSLVLKKDLTGYEKREHEGEVYLVAPVQ